MNFQTFSTSFLGRRKLKKALYLSLSLRCWLYEAPNPNCVFSLSAFMQITLHSISVSTWKRDDKRRRFSYLFDTENNCCSHHGKTLGKQNPLQPGCAVVDSAENAKAYKNKDKLSTILTGSSAWGLCLFCTCCEEYTKAFFVSFPPDLCASPGFVDSCGYAMHTDDEIERKFMSNLLRSRNKRDLNANCDSSVLFCRAH